MSASVEGRVPIQLTEEEHARAVRIARKREKHPRKEEYRPTGMEGYQRQLMGAMAEIAAAKFYGVELDLVYGRRDDGADLKLEVDGSMWALQVKSNSHFARTTKLYAMPHEMRRADAYLLCCVDTTTGYVELVGTAPTPLLWNQPIRTNKARGGKEIRCRWLTEDQLRRPKKPKRNEVESPIGEPVQSVEEHPKIVPAPPGGWTEVSYEETTTDYWCKEFDRWDFSTGAPQPPPGLGAA